MRSFYVRRKDLDHVPFQYYVNSDGTARLLDDGYTGVFTLLPPKGEIDTFYVRLTNELIRDMAERWGILQADLMRVAAKGVEAWLKGDPIPADHFYGPEWLKLDLDWFPRDPDGAPSMAVDPYSFQVVTDEPWPSILDWDFDRPRIEELGPARSDGNDTPVFVFGFTLEIFPAMVIVGYEQMKHKVEQAGLNVQVKMLPLDDLPATLHSLFVPLELDLAARQAAPAAQVYPLAEMVNALLYDHVLLEFKPASMANLT